MITIQSLWVLTILGSVFLSGLSFADSNFISDELQRSIQIFPNENCPYFVPRQLTVLRRNAGDPAGLTLKPIAGSLKLGISLSTYPDLSEAASRELDWLVQEKKICPASIHQVRVVAVINPLLGAITPVIHTHRMGDSKESIFLNIYLTSVGQEILLRKLSEESTSWSNLISFDINLDIANPVQKFDVKMLLPAPALSKALYSSQTEDPTYREKEIDDLVQRVLLCALNQSCGFQMESPVTLSKKAMQQLSDKIKPLIKDFFRTDIIYPDQGNPYLLYIYNPEKLRDLNPTFTISEQGDRTQAKARAVLYCLSSKENSKIITWSKKKECEGRAANY